MLFQPARYRHTDTDTVRDTVLEIHNCLAKELGTKGESKSKSSKKYENMLQKWTIHVVGGLPDG